MADEGYLKLPVVLKKISSKTDRDHELMWQMSFETHSRNADQVQTLVPFVDKAFVLLLVPVNSMEEIEAAAPPDDIDLGEPEKKKPKKKAKSPRKTAKKGKK